jgi:hypothetical protein
MRTSFEDRAGFRVYCKSKPKSLPDDFRSARPGHARQREAAFDGVLSMVPSGNPGFDMLASALEDLVESWKRTRDDDGNVTATPYERPLAHKV